MNQGRTLTLSELLALDPQMAMPERPRVPADLLRVTDNLTTEMVFGAASTVVFGGKAVSTLFPHLYPLLDGRRDLEEIAARLDHIPPAHLQKAISMMYMKGIIEDGMAQHPLDPALARRFPAQLQFYSRYLDMTRVYRNREDVLHRLRDARVLLITDAPAAPSLVADLAEFGLGQLDLVCSDALAAQVGEHAPDLQTTHLRNDPASYLADAARQAPQGHAIVILLLQQHSPALLEALNLASRDTSARVAYAVMGPTRVQIGPIMERDFTPCFACAGDTAPGEDACLDALAVEYGVHTLGLACLNLLTHLAPITTADSIQVLCRDTLDFDAVPLYRQPGCAVCGLGGAKGSDLTSWFATGGQLRHSLAWFYNENANFKRHHMIPKGHQAHYEEKNTRAAAGAVKKLANAPSQHIELASELPAGLLQPYAGEYAVASDCNDVALPQRVNMLLSVAATRRVQPIAEGMEVGFRVVPSGGALSSQNLYLVNFSVPTLQPGIFYCNPDGDFNRVGDGIATLQDLGLLVPPDAQRPAPQAAVVITEAYGRVESKYMGISYRYTLSDAGAMLATLMALAPRVGIALAHTANFYDDTLADTLRCQGITEYPALVCLLYDGTAEATAREAA
ncbi:hypothetical protein [Stenotrophomonas maltophilia]|uniref:hypothetical protein n=1 Tax=Stenotrophomonas maltophilia TaxID=40324 RepID=UPI0007F0296C|nr:hypothetical protein [Stenotrophomonas maltophilia]OBU49742.1 hypothetical protein A9K69_19530 [Stenotrophomonas maltophilia]